MVAFLLDHVEPGFPYISDTGNLPPESCIFGQFLAIVSFLVKKIINSDHEKINKAKKKFLF